MSYFAGLGDYNNTTGVGPTASNVVDGDSTRQIDGDIYDEQNGDTTLFWTGSVSASRKGWSNSLLVGCDFATTLGDSNIVLMGLNTKTTAGGVIDTTVSLALTGVLGVDVDAKFGGQNRLVYGNLYRQKATTYRSTPATGNTLRSDESILREQVVNYFDERLRTVSELQTSFIQQTDLLEEHLNTAFGQLQVKVLGVYGVTVKYGGALSISCDEESAFMMNHGPDELSARIQVASPSIRVQGALVEIG